MRIVFLGFQHRLRDPRLFHRQMRILKAACQDVELFFMKPSSLYDISSCSDVSRYLTVSSASDSGYSRKTAIIRQMPELRKLQPSVIQASDARELVWAVLFRWFTGAQIIYDSHEDYFNLVFEYSGKTPRSWVSAVKVSAIEIILLRFFKTVFCTDEFLFEKYTRPIYGCRSVKLLRNFPPREVVATQSSYRKKSKLDLVYIGGVNPYRGVVECAEYVARFNAKHSPTCALTFTVYSPSDPIVDSLVGQGRIRHFSWIDYAKLMEELPGYDVGICLWHRLKKYERNLPLKNFDYMAAGLPIITSSFGNLAKYARLSGGAICIDPWDYDAFETAALNLFDPSLRRQLGEAGRSFIVKHATFESEASDYVKAMTGGVDFEAG